jgi:hypothetical protein
MKRVGIAEASDGMLLEGTKTRLYETTSRYIMKKDTRGHSVFCNTPEIHHS